MSERQQPSRDALRRREEQEQHIAALFMQLPASFQEHFRPYIFGNTLNTQQRHVLAEQAAEASDSQALDTVLERAKAWELAKWQETHDVGKVAVSGDLNQTPVSADSFLEQVLQRPAETAQVPMDETSKRPITETETLVRDSATANSVPSQSHHTVPTQPLPTYPEHTSVTGLSFADFKKAFRLERQAMSNSEEPDEFFGFTAGTGDPYDEKFVKRVIETAINKKVREPFLGDNAVPDTLAPAIYRSLYTTQRGKVINFPPQFSPTRLEQALEASTFDPLPSSRESPILINPTNVQLAPSAITSIKIATREGGRIVDLPPSQQPQNLLEFFNHQLGGALTPEVFEVLKGKGEEGRVHAKPRVEEMRFGALKNGTLGVEVVIRQPEAGVDNKEEFARLGAVLLGESTRADFFVRVIKIY